MRGATCRSYAWADGDAHEYEGFVHRVEAGSLLIVFSATFHKQNVVRAVRLQTPVFSPSRC